MGDNRYYMLRDEETGLILEDETGVPLKLEDMEEAVLFGQKKAASEPSKIALLAKDPKCQVYTLLHVQAIGPCNWNIRPRVGASVLDFLHDARSKRAYGDGL
jgi:hypothetical protein